MISRPESRARARLAGPVGSEFGGSAGRAALFFSGSKLLREAYAFAADAHAGQFQESDGTPYIEHPVAVARLLQRAGFGDEVVAAGLLHDTVEDTDVELRDLERLFGSPVAELVSAMTEPDRLSDFRIRKAAHRTQIADSGCEAAAIFAADKVANAHNLRRALADQGEDNLRRRLSKPLEQKIEHYRKTLQMLDELQLPLSMIPLLRKELEELEAQRSATPRPTRELA